MSKLVLLPAIPWAGVQLWHSSPAWGARKKLAEKLGFRRSGWISCLEADCNLERKSRVRHRWLGTSLSFNFLQLPSFIFSFWSPLEFQQHLTYFDWSSGNRSGPGVIQISKWHPWWWKMRCFCWFSEGWFFRLGSTRKLPNEKKTRPRCFKDKKDLYSIFCWCERNGTKHTKPREKLKNTLLFIGPKGDSETLHGPVFLGPKSPQDVSTPRPVAGVGVSKSAIFLQINFSSVNIFIEWPNYNNLTRPH